MWSARSAAAAALVLSFASAGADAGRRPFIWTWDTEIVPEGDVELEQWLWARASTKATDTAAYWVWWAPVIGLNSHLELAVPFQVLSKNQWTALESFEADLRWRVRPREEESGFQPLVRAAFHLPIDRGGEPRLDVNLVGAWGAPREMHVAVDLGARLDLPRVTGSPRAYGARLVATYAAGIAFPLGEEWRLSGEVFGEIPLNPPALDKQHHMVGASASWTRGRLWLTAGVLVGLVPLFPDTPLIMPRLIWAVVL